MAISLQRVIRSTSCLVLGWGFRGQRIERRYLRFEQIQDGGRRHFGTIANGHISLYSAHRAVVFAIAQLSCFSLGVVFTLTSKNLPCPVMLVFAAEALLQNLFPLGTFFQ